MRQVKRRRRFPPTQRDPSIKSGELAASLLQRGVLSEHCTGASGPAVARPFAYQWTNSRKPGICRAFLDGLPLQLGYESARLVQGEAAEHDNDDDGEDIGPWKTPELRHGISLVVVANAGRQASAVSRMRCRPKSLSRNLNNTRPAPK